MKKFAVASFVVALAVGAVGIGAVAAQAPQPPAPGGGQGFGRGFGPMAFAGGEGTEGPMHDYMLNAIADALSISPAEFESRRDAGETAYQIASDLGISPDTIPALLSDARSKALEAAAADGVISQDQAAWMESRGAGRGAGNCLGNQGQIGLGRGWRAGQATP